MIEHGPETPRDARGVSSWARRFNAATDDVVAAWCRVWSLAWSVLTAAAAFLAIFSPSWDALGAVGLCAGLLAVHIWLGFFVLANPSWREGRHADDTDGDAA